MTLGLGLGIDVGGTATRWTLADAAGRAAASGTAPPFTGHIFTDDVRARVAGLIADLARDVVAAGRPDGIFAGVTGLGPATPQAAFLIDLLARETGVAPARIAAVGDTELAYRACFQPGAGILVYAGTGSVATHIAADGAELLIGGRGVLIDDGGSAFWIAARALRHVLRAEESQPGSGWGTPLGQHLAAGVGGATWEAARAHVYGGDRGRMAQLARGVGLAAGAGDAAALAILARAGAELARLAHVLIGRIGDKPVALAGAAQKIHPGLFAAFRAAIPAHVPVVADASDAALAAAVLAAGGLPAR